MWQPVLREKNVKNGVLFGSLRLIQQADWRENKSPAELTKLARKINQIMQLHMNSEQMVIGIPVANHQVHLLELPQKSPSGTDLHQIKQIHESAAGYYVRTQKIA